ncbi:MAG: PKD domain-containing protein [Solirubrobacteraceae bacterium]
MRLLLATFTLLLALAAPAAAAPTWLTPVPLSPRSTGEVSAMDIASDDAGHIAAVWNKFLGMGNNRSQISLRSPGGPFTPALSFSDASNVGTDPAVGIAGDGVATVVWHEMTGASQLVKVARFDRAGGRAADQTLSTAGDNPRVAVAPNGVAVATWVEGNAINAAVRDSGGGAFIDIGAISATAATGIDIDHAVALDADGDGVAAWVRDGNVETNRRPRGGTFLGVQPIPGGGTANSLELAMAPNGRATAIWALATTPSEVRTSERTVSPDFANGNWNLAGRASPLGLPATSPSVAVDADNTAIGVWRVTDGGNEVVQGAERPSGGSFRDFRPLSNSTSGGFSAQVDVAPDGAAVVIWAGLSGGQSAIQATRRGPGLGGEFGAVADVALGTLPTADPTTSLFNPVVAVDGEGNAAATWSRFRQDTGMTINDWELDAAGFDAAPPALSAVSVPPNASRGAGVGMAAAATDRWTPVSFAWNFGDGTTGAGDAVTHAFGSAGTFPVTVTARDGVGNASSATRQILISRDIPRRIDSTVQTRWAFDAATGKRFVLLRLRVKDVPKGGAVQIRCKGKQCPYKSKRSTKRRKGDITMFKNRSAGKAVRSKGRRFRAGQTVQVRVTKAGFIGKVVKFKLKRRKDPVGKVLCIPVGKTKPRKSC